MVLSISTSDAFFDLLAKNSITHLANSILFYRIAMCRHVSDQLFFASSSAPLESRISRISMFPL